MAVNYYVTRFTHYDRYVARAGERLKTARPRLFTELFSRRETLWSDGSRAE